MFKSSSIYVKALYLSLPVFLILVGSEFYLDYKNDGSINGSLNDGEGYFWIFLILGPAFAVGLPWSAIGFLVLFILAVVIYKSLKFLGMEVPETAIMVIGGFLFYATIFASLYINGLIVARKKSVLGVGSILTTLTFVYVLIPLVLISIGLMLR